MRDAMAWVRRGADAVTRVLAGMNSAARGWDDWVRGLPQEQLQAADQGGTGDAATQSVPHSTFRQGSR